MQAEIVQRSLSTHASIQTFGSWGATRFERGFDRQNRTIDAAVGQRPEVFAATFCGDKTESYNDW